MKPFYDIAIVGSGYGGSLLAMVARRLGRSVLLLERGHHPRFAIGESTSPLANLLLEQLAQRYDLPRLLPLTSYGPWQRTYPQVGCGLKRGFTYFGHARGEAYQAAPDRSNQLLVAASPNDETADTHWLRADVDTFLMREAVAAGADYVDRVTLDAPAWDDGPSECRLSGTRRDGRPFTTRARLLVDATGPRGFLGRALRLPPSSFPDYPPTQSLYSHFTNVRRCDGLGGFLPPDAPPYPADDAAVHHVFDGGWMWVLRLGDRLSSAGIVVTNPLAQELNLSEGPAAWRRFLGLFPSVAAQFEAAKAVRPFVHAPRVAWRTSQAAGPGWAMLPSAAAFVDPLFSTGIPLTLLGVERLGRVLEDGWGGSLDARLEDYAAQTLQEADAVADFIGACYASMPRFPVFAALSLFYFAAASYSEMARRLDRPHLSGGFLAASHPQFGPGLRRATAWARELAECPTADTAAFQSFVAEAVSCLNVAGLADPDKRNWYGVDLNDVVAGAAKLGLTPDEMRQVLKDAPWAQGGSCD